MTKEQYWRPIYIISGIWKDTGWASIIYLAVLISVDIKLHEAAHIDGASQLKRIWHINVPGIVPTAILLFIMNCGQIMSVGFEKVYLLQNSINLPISEVISTYVYKTGLLGAKFSYTAAIGLFNSFIHVKSNLHKKAGNMFSGLFGTRGQVQCCPEPHSSLFLLEIYRTSFMLRKYNILIMHF